MGLKYTHPCLGAECIWMDDVLWGHGMSTGLRSMDIFMRAKTGTNIYHINGRGSSIPKTPVRGSSWSLGIHVDIDLMKDDGKRGDKS